VKNNMIRLIEYLEKEFPKYLKQSPPEDIYPFHRGTLAIDWRINHEFVIHIEVGKTALLCMVTPESQAGSKPTQCFL
jgi:hypothetical protein